MMFIVEITSNNNNAGQILSEAVRKDGQSNKICDQNLKKKPHYHRQRFFKGQFMASSLI